MVTIDVRHKVENFEQWKQVFDAARSSRREAGELACRVYTVHGSTTDVLVSMDWESLEKARAFLTSPKLMEGMSRAGVREMPILLILEQRDGYSL